MKKLSLLLAVCFIIPACSGSQTKTSQAAATPQTPDIKKVIASNILVSNAAAVEENLNKVETIENAWLSYAVGICDPYRRQYRNEKEKFVCDKEQNAKIIQMLIDRGADPNKFVNFAKKEANTLYVVETLADKLALWNKDALQTVLKQTDKCLIALTKMQTAEPTNPKYFAFADYWRNNNCSIDNYNLRWFGSTTDKEKAAFLIGKTKEAVKNAYGEPTVYAHPSEYREVLTYKRAEERKELGKYEAGVRAYEIYTDEVDYVFTLDRGVVSKVQVKTVSTTKAGEETKELDLEKAKQVELENKEKLAGTKEDPMKRMRGKMRGKMMRGS